jgi:hypothetical protein
MILLTNWNKTYMTNTFFTDSDDTSITRYGYYYIGSTKFIASTWSRLSTFFCWKRKKKKKKIQKITMEKIKKNRRGKVHSERSPK